MRIELIQPFINATDAVLAEMFQGPATVSDVGMQEEIYRRKGIAACVVLHGDIEGRVVFDLDRETATRVASALQGEEPTPSEEVARETVCELANIVVGNAVTLLNDQGHRFKVLPPEVHAADKGYGGGIESEALVMCFKTCLGNVYLNMALDYSPQHAAFVREPLT